MLLGLSHEVLDVQRPLTPQKVWYIMPENLAKGESGKGLPQQLKMENKHTWKLACFATSGIFFEPIKTLFCSFGFCLFVFHSLHSEQTGL